jgi:hypothetical protein
MEDMVGIFRPTGVPKSLYFMVFYATCLKNIFNCVGFCYFLMSRFGQAVAAGEPVAVVEIFVRQAGSQIDFSWGPSNSKNN